MHRWTFTTPVDPDQRWGHTMTNPNDTVTHITIGLHNAWADMHDPRRSVDYRHDRTTNSYRTPPPHRDPTTLAAYRKAQTAITYAYYQAVAAGVPAFWPTVRHTDTADPDVLAVVARRLAHHTADADVITAQLDAAAKALRPWWRTPTQPRQCQDCMLNRAAPDRQTCWACAKRRTRRRTKTIR